MSTSISSFTEAVSSFLANHVLTSLANWIEQHKGIQITVDEMIAALDLPVTRMAPVNNLPAQIPVIPPFLKGTGAVTPTGSKGKVQGRGRKKTTEPVVDANAPRCIYVFQRGTRTNQTCGELAVDNTGYCRSCLKKRGVQQKIQKVGDAPVQQPPLQLSNGSVVVPSNDADPELDVMPLPDRPGFFRDVNHGFIVQQLPNGTVLAVKIDDGHSERDLTEEEKRLADSIGISVALTPVVERVVVHPIQIPNIPTLENAVQPKMPAILPLPNIKPLPPLGHTRPN